MVEFLLCKYIMKEIIKKADMLKIVHKRYREYLPEICRKVSDLMDLDFGLEL